MKSLKELEVYKISKKEKTTIKGGDNGQDAILKDKYDEAWEDGRGEFWVSGTRTRKDGKGSRHF